jgi:Domain of unknown function (DUF4189)
MKVGIALAVVVVVSTTQMITVHPAHAYQFGALAASCNQWFGVGYSNVNLNDAKRRAVYHCSHNCEPVATVSGGGCTAFAVSGTECGYPTGVGYGAIRSAARTDALRKCNSNWGLPEACRFLAAVCPAAPSPLR